MGILAQSVLPFKVEETDELLTANAGLTLFGEFVCVGFLASTSESPPRGFGKPALPPIRWMVMLHKS